ncbi:hypothetical protein BHM03_00010043 [Ensete ventricosum]|nr:hypothetical protein BHM03_00010043 [Ensete ventricosum]
MVSNLFVQGPLLTDPANKRAYICRFSLVAFFFCIALLVGSPSLINHYKHVCSFFHTFTCY